MASFSSRPEVAIQVCPLPGTLVSWSAALGAIAARLGWRGVSDGRFDQTGEAILAATLLPSVVGDAVALVRDAPPARVPPVAMWRTIVRLTRGCMPTVCRMTHAARMSLLHAFPSQVI